MYTKKKAILNTAITCALMIYIMGIYNIAFSTESLSPWMLWASLKSLPLMFAAGLALEFLCISKFAKWIAFKVVAADDSPRMKILTISFCMTICMAACMTLLGLIISGGLASVQLGIWFLSFSRNFIFAIFLQWIIVGPSVRKLLKVNPAGRTDEKVKSIPDAENTAA